MDRSDGFTLLEKIFQILKDEGVLQPKQGDAVIKFKDPKELLVRSLLFLCILSLTTFYLLERV